MIERKRIVIGEPTITKKDVDGFVSAVLEKFPEVTELRSFLKIRAELPLSGWLEFVIEDEILLLKKNRSR